MKLCVLKRNRGLIMPLPLLEVDNLSVCYQTRRPFRQGVTTVALHGVSLSIEAGETIGLVGKSGSGKSTLARAILKLVRPDSGRILVNGQDIWAQTHRQERAYRGRVQAVFQDPHSILNPSHTVRTIIGDFVTRHQGVMRGVERDEIVISLLEQVGLSGQFLNRYSAQLSGGQQQRVAIARALAAQPELIVCDEPTSALDVSVQSKVINLLRDLQANLGVAYLFISHDLAVVRYISHRIGVLKDGELLEMDVAERVCRRPQHPYTRQLLDAILPVPQ